MTSTWLRRAPILAGVFAVLALAAPAAEAKGKLDGQLIAAATTSGSKVTAPILLTEKSAKQLKLRSPLATLTTKASQKLQAPSPTGQGTVQIAAGTLRAGDALTGKGKLKGSKKAMMPKLKGSNLAVTGRESAYSVDELTGALVALYQQVGALGIRVTELETGLASLRAELEALKAQNASLEGQINSILTQITNLDAALDALTTLVGGLPTQAQLDAVIQSIDDLQSQLDALGIDDIDGLQSELTDLQSQITALDDTIDLICGTLPVC